jgi:hypothetical protein
VTAISQCGVVYSTAQSVELLRRLADSGFWLGLCLLFCFAASRDQRVSFLCAPSTQLHALEFMRLSPLTRGQDFPVVCHTAPLRRYRSSALCGKIRFIYILNGASAIWRAARAASSSAGRRQRLQRTSAPFSLSKAPEWESAHRSGGPRCGPMNRRFSQRVADKAVTGAPHWTSHLLF